MFHIAEEEINYVRQNADIVEIISSYIPLNQKGKNYFGVCPFHADHSPSMSVSREKGIFKCFSCGATGNVFKFVSEYENLTFPEAVQKIAEKIGVSLSVKNERKQITKNEIEYKIMELSNLFYQNNLMTEKGEKARNYLESRGLNEEIQKEFQIGLALEKNSLSEFLHQKKYDNSYLISLGLLNQKNEYFYDTFNNRIIFPIHNLNGEVVGFTGRVYLPDSSPPKYLNSKETVIFKKGHILFNYHRAKDKIRLEKKVILVEGNMDAIRMFACGFQNTIALMGTSLTAYQMKEIKKLRVPVILMLDNDEAGLTATYQLGMNLEKEEIATTVVRLSGEKDPDEYLLKNGSEAMYHNIKNAVSFLEFKLNYFKKNKNLQNSEELAAYIKEVLNGMKENKDPILREITLKKLSHDYDISLDILKKEMESLEDKEIHLMDKKILKQEKENQTKKTKYTDSLFHILYFMMNDPIYIKMYKKNLGFIDHFTYRGIANEIMAYYEFHKTINLADFLTFAENSKLKKEIYEIVTSINDETIDETIMEEYIMSVKKIRKQNEIKKLKEKLKSEMDSNKELEIVKRITELKKEV